jgi:transcriptional regulator
MAGKFALQAHQHRQDLLQDNPFCWIVSHVDDAFRASAIPVRPLVAQGVLYGFQGHFARSNPHVALLRRDARALLLVQGPHHYVSPSWLRDRTQAPTWNYAASQYQIELRLLEDPGRIEAILLDLIDAVEAGRASRWSLDEMRQRYAGLAARIIGFEADIVGQHTTCKLGQDERDDVYADIRAGLSAAGAHALVGWMQRYNGDRGDG